MSTFEQKIKKVMQKLFLLDAYALIYRSYYAFIKNPRINSKGLNTSAIIGFCNTLNEVLQKEQPTHIGVAFDPHGPTPSILMAQRSEVKPSQNIKPSARRRRRISARLCQSSRISSMPTAYPSFRLTVMRQTT